LLKIESGTSLVLTASYLTNANGKGGHHAAEA
jgi:hypothetical protein